MLIILEGPDGGGKTTLAERLITQLTVKYPRHHVELLHRGPPTAHPLDEYVTPLLDYVPGGDRHVVCDRWHLGEWVYPRIKGRPTKMDHAVFTYVEMFLRARGALTVVINPPVAVLQERVLQRGDDYVRVGELPALREAFQLNMLPACMTQISYSGTPLVDPIIAQAWGAQSRSVVFNHFVTPVGPHRPEFLLFGDLRNCDGVDCDHKQHHDTAGTAFMPYPSTSGHYLLTALRDSTLPLRSVLANACDTDDPTSLWTALGKPAAVALGRRAHRCLTQRGVPHATVPHPQFVRRFHHREAERYGKLIESVTGTTEDMLSWRP